MTEYTHAHYFLFQALILFARNHNLKLLKNSYELLLLESVHFSQHCSKTTNVKVQTTEDSQPLFSCGP